MSNSLRECTDLVGEVLTAMRVFTPEGGSYTGESLFRWRELPAVERAYFSALLSPYIDPHAFVRTQTVVSTEDGCRYEYSHPFPEPCGCGVAVHGDWFSDAVRCSRCLHAWPLKRALASGHKPELLREPLFDSVDRKNIGYAIERLPAVTR